MENKIIEIVEFGYPRSIVQRDNEPITELIDTELMVEELESRIKELESEKSTELKSEYKGYFSTTIYSCKKCNTEILRTSYNFCPNCGRKIVR